MARVIQADKVIDAEEGDLRVWWVRNPPSPSEYHIVSSPAGAITVLQKLTTADLRNPLITVNVGGLEVFEDDEWTEWYDEHGNDIDHLNES
jgi:hypothetical protein